MRTIRRGGPYLRVADPGWDDPLDGGYAAERGGRWNPPESFSVVYLCRSIEVARANVYRKLEGQPYGPEDLRIGPILVRTKVPEDRYLNAVTDAGLRDLGLPRTYPLDSRRHRVSWRRCQPIGLRAWEAGLPGVAARSAAAAAGEELSYFGRRKLRRGAVRIFDQWFWEAPTD
ncbi:MAG TPA: RES family NAD+ phosphorylase [Solirubrobacterales bacterium]